VKASAVDVILPPWPFSYASFS